MSDRDDFLRDRQPPPTQAVQPPPVQQPRPAQQPPPPPVQRPAQPQPEFGWAGSQPAPFPVPGSTATPPPPPTAAQQHRGWPDPGAQTVVTRAAKPRPIRGWRRAVYAATFGLVNLGPSPAERHAAHLEAVIAAPLRGHFKVGVLGKGGVGKTTVAASVGSVFAELRHNDRVVAVDADTAFGRLGSRIDPTAGGSYWELAADKNLDSFADLRGRVGNNAAGLYVLAGEPPTGRRRVLDPAIYREAALRLDRHFTIRIVDCGSTMDAPVTQEALRDLDALIVVSSPWADGASAAAQTMEWLSTRGMTDMLSRTVVVLNDSDGHSDKRTRAVLAQQFTSRGQVVVEVPFDPHLRPGGVIDVTSEMAPNVRMCFLEITATVARHFATRAEART